MMTNRSPIYISGVFWGKRSHTALVVMAPCSSRVFKIGEVKVGPSSLSNNRDTLLSTFSEGNTQHILPLELSASLSRRGTFTSKPTPKVKIRRLNLLAALQASRILNSEVSPTVGKPSLSRIATGCRPSIG